MRENLPHAVIGTLCHEFSNAEKRRRKVKRAKNMT